MSKVHISDTVSGFLPVLWTGEGADMDREAYSTSFADLPQAEAAGRAWADQEGATYVPYEPIDHEAINRRAALIRRLREDEGLTLREAVDRAKSMTVDA
jgi:hypothetical protein